jgi:hypothetical protein
MPNFIGQINQSVETNITIKCCISRSHWNNKKIYIATDDNKNIITFNSNLTFPVNQNWKLHGKVKRHRVFNKQKQTHIQDWYLSLC